MAQEETASPFYDFMYGRYLLKDYYDVDLQPDDYVERAFNVFRAIGNIATGIHHIKVTIDQSGRVALPCNMEFIESVSTNRNNYEGGEFTLLYSDMNLSPNGYLADIVLDQSRNRVSLPAASKLHPVGSFIQYELKGTVGCKYLQFTSEYIGTSIVCIYRGVMVDADNNPLLFRKEAEAIAAQLAFIDVRKRCFMKDPTAMAMLQYAQAEANQKMAAAKIPEYVTQNQWNRVFSALTTHNRKTFYNSYKSIQ